MQVYQGKLKPNKKSETNHLWYKDMPDYINMGLYEVYGDDKYINEAHDLIKKTIKYLDPEKTDLYLSYPIPKRINELYNKSKKPI